MSTPLWVLAATGRPLPEDLEVEIRAATGSVNSLAEGHQRVRHWSTTVSVHVQKWGEDDELVEVESHEVGYCLAYAFEMPFHRSQAMGLCAFTDEDLPNLSALAAAMACEPHVEEALEDSMADRCLYIDGVSVPKEVRGHQWSRTAMAAMLDALASSIGVAVFAHTPLEGPEKKIMASSFRSFSMKKLHKNLYMANTNENGITDAVLKRLSQSRLRS